MTSPRSKLARVIRREEIGYRRIRRRALALISRVGVKWKNKCMQPPGLLSRNEAFTLAAGRRACQPAAKVMIARAGGRRGRRGEVRPAAKLTRRFGRADALAPRACPAIENGEAASSSRGAAACVMSSG